MWKILKLRQSETTQIKHALCETIQLGTLNNDLGERIEHLRFILVLPKRRDVSETCQRWQ